MEAIKTWYISMMDKYIAMGLATQYDMVAMNPLQLSEKMVHDLAKDLPKIGYIARKLAMNRYLADKKEVKLKDDYKAVADAYIHAPRRPIIMRADGIVVNNQLKLLELNIDSAIGGVWEVDLIQQEFFNRPGFSISPNQPLITPKQGLLNYLKKSIESLAHLSEINLALVGRIDFDPYYIDQAHDMCEWFNHELGINAHFCYPEYLRAGEPYVTDGSKNYHIIYKDSALVHAESKTASMLSLLKDAAKTQTLVLSDPIDLLIEHKEILAYMYEACQAKNSILTPEEKALIKKYIPFTQLITNDPSLSTKLLEEKDNHVIKRGYSHEGQHVHIGAELDQADWQDLVSKVLQDTTHQWIMQENLKSNTYPFEYLNEHGNVITKQQRYTLNPYVYGDTLAGMLVRIEKDQKNRVLALQTNSAMSSTGVMVL